MFIEPRPHSSVLSAYPAFGISVNLGSVTSSNAPIVWSLRYVRDPSISYTLSGQNITLHPYYTTKYEAVLDAVSSTI